MIRPGYEQAVRPKITTDTLAELPLSQVQGGKIPRISNDTKPPLKRPRPPSPESMKVSALNLRLTNLQSDSSHFDSMAEGGSRERRSTALASLSAHKKDRCDPFISRDASRRTAPKRSYVQVEPE